MNQQIKRRWVKALRSGAFKQHRGDLVHKNAYCCIGVLCIAANRRDLLDGYSQDAALMAGQISDEDASILVSANDTFKWSFDEIADYVDIML